MDGDPFAKAMDRIRLIGRLFFLLGGRRLKLRSLLLFLLFTLLQNFGYFFRFLWANHGHPGQNRGQQTTSWWLVLLMITP